MAKIEQKRGSNGDLQQHRHIGRNEPCWCGSGKKYKHCHLSTDEKAEAEALLPKPEVPKDVWRY